MDQAQVNVLTTTTKNGEHHNHQLVPMPEIDSPLKSNSLSPFIKRKCLSKEDTNGKLGLKSMRRASFMGVSSSPYSIQMVSSTKSEMPFSNSPKLNERLSSSLTSNFFI